MTFIDPASLPVGVTLVTPPPPPAAWCVRCHDKLTYPEPRLVFKLHLNGTEARDAATACATCWASGKFIVEDGVVYGWACWCCTCPPVGPFDWRCRSHAAPHDEAACELHRQPATTCDCGCHEATP